MYEWLVLEWGVAAALAVFAVNVGAIVVTALLVVRWRRRRKKAQR